MKTYLSFGAGVNSVAMMLLLLDEGWDFESVYVDHGCDWPETIEYVQMLKDKGYQITILTPDVQGESSLYSFCLKRNILPSRMFRWCTDKFKIRTLHNYFETPAFTLIGYDAGEANRATITTHKGTEHRFPLIERDINRGGCVDIIKSFGLPIPTKSGCFFCCWQTIPEWKRLRRERPDLFCKSKELEDRVNKKRIQDGKQPIYLSTKPLDVVVNEAQRVLFEELKPPCYCMR